MKYVKFILISSYIIFYTISVYYLFTLAYNYIWIKICDI